MATLLCQVIIPSLTSRSTQSPTNEPSMCAMFSHGWSASQHHDPLL